MAASRASVAAEPQGVLRGPIGRPQSIDDLDRAIIAALQANGRESFRRIAADLGVSEATIRNRYARLCDANVLQVTGVTNPLGLGFDAQAMLGVRTNGPPEPVASEVGSWREAGYVVITAGQFDLLVEVLCTDRRHLLDIINRVRALDGVVSTESFVYLELWKQVYDWGRRLGSGDETIARTANGATTNRR
ncbi:MAG: Lrp/AsnC family transcriptional regulator [Actinobacteria bacterium]|nr:Lrp/AsnC family transcriptional regulator [Actinomycetota bacterium]